MAQSRNVNGTGRPATGAPRRPRAVDPAPGEAVALAQPSRRRMAAELAARPDGMTAQELADSLGLHHNAIRRHLTVLSRAGVVSATRSAVSGRPGRPSIRYHLSSPDSVAAEGHRELVRLLLSLVRRAGAGERDVEEVGRDEGRLLGEPGGGPGELVRSFARLGFAPEEVTSAAERRDGVMELRLMNCPFREAVLAPGGELVCVLHRGLTLGILDRAAEDANLGAFQPRDPVQAGCRVMLRGVEAT